MRAGRRRRSRLPPLLAAFALAASPASANQGLVARDGTLGSGALEVAAGIDPLDQPADYLITPELGEQHGANLFHSFSRFGIGTGETATFTGPDPVSGPQSVANIIGRVTGGSASEVDGTLRSTIPGAALWLINPRGIVFGAGAQLDVAGSFHAATADSLAFDDAGLVRFYANPSHPSVLAIAEPRAFGFLSESGAAPISVSGAKLETSRLGDTLSLVGGDVVLDGATLRALNGRVNLAATASAGDVVLAPASGGLPLGTSTFAMLGNITLAANCLVDTGGDAPGAIFIRGGRVEVESSQVLAENHGGAAGGQIDVDVRDQLDANASLLSVATDAAGDAGTIRLRGGAIVFRNGPGLFVHHPPPAPLNSLRAFAVGANAGTSGSGAGGTLQIDARSLEVIDGAALGAMSAGAAASGRAGAIRISADAVDLRGGAVISTGAWGSEGDGGTISIRAGAFTLDGTDRYAVLHASAEGARTTTGVSAGAPGTIEIDAGSVRVLNGASIEDLCWSCSSKREARSPDAGTIRIRAGELVVDGSHGTTSYDNSIVIVGTFGADGDAGQLEVDVEGLLQLTRDGFLANTTLGGSGDAGDISVRAGSIRIADFGSGIYTSSDRLVPTSLPSTGAAGAIAVHTGSLRISNGAGITAQSEGAGDAGRIAIDAASVQVDSGGLITTASYGTGNAGSIAITAGETIQLSAANQPRFNLGGVSDWPPGVFSLATGGGNGGSIALRAPEITVTDGAVVASSTVFSAGTGGAVRLEADRIRILGGGSVDTSSVGARASAGHIALLSRESIDISGSSEFGDVSRVASIALGSASAGDVVLDAPHVLVDGGAVATTALPLLFEGTFYPGGKGGAVRIEASDLLVRGGGRIDSSSLGTGEAGTIDVHASGSLEIDGEGSAISSRTGGAAAGGRITLGSERVEIRDGAEISARSEPGFGDLRAVFSDIADQGLLGSLPEAATGDAGDIAIRATDVVILDGGSRIEATAGDGSGGRIAITTQGVFMSPGSEVSALAGKLGIDGTVEIHSPDVDLSGTLAALPAAFLDATSLLHARCAARLSGERVGSFTVRGAAGVPAEPEGPLPATELAAAVRAGSDAMPELIAVASLLAIASSSASCL